MSTPAKTPRDPAASMSLITELMRHPLDPAYEAEAAKRRANGLPASTGLRSPWLVLVAILIGVGLAASALSLRVPLGAQKTEHDQLVKRINTGQHSIETDIRTIDGLRKDITARQDAALKRNNRSGITTQITSLESVTGAGAVKGPGLVVSVDNPVASSQNAGGDARTDSTTNNVTSADLQVIVNGLWNAGAQAIAINDQRLGSTSAIRFAGEAILVNFRPLTPPYVISAIGPPSMAEAFKNNPGGAYLDGLVSQFGVRSSRHSDSALTLPALVSPSLVYAKPVKENP